MNKQASIKDLEVRDVVIGMAEILEVDYDEDNNEICINIPKKLGSGYIKATSFDFGMGVLEIDCQLSKAFELVFDKTNVQPLKLLFNRESEFTHKFGPNGEKHSIKSLESAILSCTRQEGNIFVFPPKMPICIFSLEINRKLFEGKIEAFVDDIPVDLESIFRDVNGINLFYYDSYYSLDISQFIDEFVECDLTGFMRSVYLEGKAYEILAHHLKQYLDDLNGPGHFKILRKSTVKSLHEAVQIIEGELSLSTNVVSLAKRVGLNQNTLQNGFQQLFKTTVNSYIRKKRLEHAKTLLETSDLNITEITYQIGINSRSYFSKLFKEQYGFTPTQYASRFRKSNSKVKSA